MTMWEVNAGSGSRRIYAVALALAALLSTAGCTSRGITITSKPPGAEVSINRRVVGVTPIRVGFTHYGGYRIELRMRGYETLVKEEDLQPGFYGYDPVALVADNVIPARLNDEVYLHYVLKPIEEKDSRASLMDRALAARNGDVTDPKTGKEIHVAMTRAPKKADDLVAAAPASEPKPPTVEDTTSDASDADRPQGLRLASEFGLTADAEKKPDFVKPEDRRKPEPVLETRTPAPEQLLFDEPAKPQPAPENTPQPREEPAPPAQKPKPQTEVKPIDKKQQEKDKKELEKKDQQKREQERKDQEKKAQTKREQDKKDQEKKDREKKPDAPN
jgi:hypothetical protein